MLSGQRQFLLIHKWLDKISIHLVYFMASAEQEELHRMRVETKKIKAMAKLSEDCSGSAKLKKGLHFLNGIYQVTGIIRESFLNIELSKRILVPEKFIREQKNIQEIQLKKLREMIPFFLLALEKNEKKLQGKIPALEEKCLRAVFERSVSEIDVAMNSGVNEELLHENRKKIKFLLYNYRIMPQRFRNELILDTKYLEQMQDKIGSWHDTVIYIQLLQQFPGDHTSLITDEIVKARELANSIYEEASDFGLKVMKFEMAEISFLCKGYRK